MAIPSFHSLMLPLLRLAEDGKEHVVHDTIAALADELGLTEDERKEVYLKSQNRVFDKRVHWAITYLSKAGLLSRTGNGCFAITPQGQEDLKTQPAKMDVAYLRRFPDFVEWSSRRQPKEDGKLAETELTPTLTPEDVIDQGYREIRRSLEVELLDRVKGCSPEFFERVVVDLLVEMGYGGSRPDAGKAIGKSGDGGVDGIIKEDKLGLDAVYLQAKRWTDNVVGRPEIQKFVGALAGKKARKGIFLTTASFSKEARDYVAGLQDKVVLLDGQELGELMVDHNVGVSTTSTYEIKKVDSDYFTEE